MADDFGSACALFRDRRYEACRDACRRALADEPAEGVEFALLLADCLQILGNPDWPAVESAARTAARLALRRERGPGSALRRAQAINRIGVARRARVCAEHEAGADPDVAGTVRQLRDVIALHRTATGILEHLGPDDLATLNPREMHATIVSGFNNVSSALVEMAHVLRFDASTADRRTGFLWTALDQFEQSRAACDHLLPEARVATLNDEAEVLLRLGRRFRTDPAAFGAAVLRAHITTQRALTLLERIDDDGQRTAWESILRAKLRYSYDTDLGADVAPSRQLLQDIADENNGRIDEIGRLGFVPFQVGTVDIYHMPWSPVGPAPRPQTADVRLGDAIAALAPVFSARHRLDSPLLRSGWHGLHIDDLVKAFDAAVSLGRHEAVCELIETCRAQGYGSAGRRRLAGDVVDSSANRAFAGIGVITVGAAPDIAVRGSSAIRQDVVESVDIETLRLGTGDDVWWWSTLLLRGTVYWSLLTPHEAASGAIVAGHDHELVPDLLRHEIRRRVRRDDPPMAVNVSPSSQLGGVRWGLQTIDPATSLRLVGGADIRIVPPAPLLADCLARVASRPPWPLKVLVMSDPLGDLALQRRVVDDLAPTLADGSVTLVTPGASRMSLLAALGATQDIPGGGTFVFTGHGLARSSGIDEVGVALDDGDVLTAADVVNWHRSEPGVRIPARVLLAGCQTLDLGAASHEWTSLAAAALFVGAELVFATTANLVSDEDTRATTVRLSEILATSPHPVADLNELQRAALRNNTPETAALRYCAVLGGRVR